MYEYMSSLSTAELRVIFLLMSQVFYSLHSDHNTLHYYYLRINEVINKMAKKKLRLKKGFYKFSASARKRRRQNRYLTSELGIKFRNVNNKEDRDQIACNSNELYGYFYTKEIHYEYIKFIRLYFVILSHKI